METRANNRLITRLSTTLADMKSAAGAVFDVDTATVSLRVGLLLALLVVTCCLPTSLHAQDVITTIAGEVGGQNVAGASFNLPTGVAVDSLGDLFVADANNCVVWKISNGVSTVIAGIPGSCALPTGSGAMQSLVYPIDVAVCGNYLYYAAHGFDPVPSGSSSAPVVGGVYEIEISSGTFSTLPLPVPPPNAESTSFPVALACDNNGNVYLASYYYSDIEEVGAVDEIPAGGGQPKNLIQQQSIAYSGITVDSENNVFVVGTASVGQGWFGTTSFAENGVIFQLINGGATNVSKGSFPNGLPNLSRLTANLAAGVGNFLVTAAAGDSKPTVYVEAVPGGILAGNGTAGFKDGVQATQGELDNATGLAVDACGSIYVADSGNNVIRKILNPNYAGPSACVSGPSAPASGASLSATLSITSGNGQILAGGSVSLFSQLSCTNCSTALEGEVFYCSFSSASFTPPSSASAAPCEGGVTLGAVAVTPTGPANGIASYQTSFPIPGTYYVAAEFFFSPYLPYATAALPVVVCGASCTDSGVPNIPVASVPVALTPGALTEKSNGGNGIVALDAKSNEYFLNSSAGTVVLVDKNSGGGTIISPSTVISTGGTLGTMNNLGDMVIGADGNLYVTDTGNNRVIQVVSPSSASPTVAVINIGSSGGTLSPPLNAPMGIFETSDEVYVTDMPAGGPPRLVAFRPDGSYPTTIPVTPPAGTPPLGQLLGIAVNPTTLAIYVANSEAPGSTSGGSIIKTTIDGTPSVVAMPTTLTLQTPYGLAMDASGGLYFSDTSTHLVYRLDIHGNVIVIAGNGTATERVGDSLLADTAVSAVQTGLANPTWLALDASNSIYILDGSNLLYLDVTQSIVDFTATGESQTVYVTNPVAGTQGSVEMEFGSPILNGADSADFSVAAGTTCSQTSSTLLSPNTSCALALTLNATGNNATATSCTLSEIEVSLGPPLTAGACPSLTTGPPPGLTAQTIHLNAIAPLSTSLQIIGAAATGTYNVPYVPAVTFTATGGSGQYTFSESGLLPSGMSLSPAGVLSGTPTQGGSFPFIVNVTDSQGDTGGLTQSLVINPAATTTTLTATPNSLGVSQPFTLTATVLYNGTPVTSSNVAFYDYNGATLGVVPLNGSGQASLAATSPATGGTYAYTATFQSTANLATSSGPANVTVTAISTTPVCACVTETILVTDSPTFPDIFDPEAIAVTDTPLIVPMPAPLSFALPVAYYSVGSVGFGTVAPGQTATQSFSLSNIGQGQLTLNGESVSGSAFSLAQIQCSNGASSSGASSLTTTLSTADVCVFTISYTAPTGAAPSGAIVFTDNSSLSNVTSTGSATTYVQSIALNGSGATTPPAAPPQMTVPVTVPEVIVVTDTPTLITPTTTTLSSSANPASYGQKVVFTATVSSVLGAPAGSVNFYDSSTLLGTATLSGGTAAFGTKLTVGTHSITANYTGNSVTNFQASTSAVLNEFVGYATKTTLTTSGSPSLINQSVTFTATVTSTYGPIPYGDTVTFYDGTTLLGTGTTGVTPAGAATFTTSALSAKTHTIKATYSGDATFKTSSGDVAQVVDPYTTTTILSTSPNPSNFGESVQLTAVVSNASGFNTPTQKVKFLNGTTSLGTGTLDPTGTATLSTGSLPVGSDSLTAEYEGDTENGTSTSSALTQTVSQAQITMSLSSSPDPSAPGKAVKFAATLKSNGSLPNGLVVTFTYNNGTPLGTATVVGGKAVFSTSILPVGHNTVTATYAGSTDYSAASATTLQIVQ